MFHRHHSHGEPERAAAPADLARLQAMNQEPVPVSLYVGDKIPVLYDPGRPDQDAH